MTLDGSDGHRDHVRIRDATLASVERAPTGIRALCLHCLPRSVMRRWADLMRAFLTTDHLRRVRPASGRDPRERDLSWVEPLAR